MCIKLDIVFGGVAPDKANGLYGITWIGILVGVILLLTAAAPIFGCKEGQLPTGEESKVSFWAAVKLTLANKSFWPLVVGNFLLKFGMVSTGIFFMYLLIYNVAGGDKQAGMAQWGVFCNVINVATFIAMAPVVWMTDRIGKKSALLTLMIASAVTYASVWFSFQPHLTGWVANLANWLSATAGIPAGISKAWPVYVTAAGIGIFCNCMPLIMNSMLADVCDVDELKSGHRREAFYGAVFVTCDKIAMGVAMLLQGFLLKASGFDAKHAVQSAETIAQWMRWLLLTQPTGFILGLIVISFYPLAKARSLAIRAELDTRNGHK
jgi:GPH family glycoside/pentoside/hexuronide:cation symporter